jgi:hypothetical protein
MHSAASQNFAISAFVAFQNIACHRCARTVSQSIPKAKYGEQDTSPQKPRTSFFMPLSLPAFIVPWKFNRSR